MIELACKEAVFHFNKKHLEDPTVPMWTVKALGKTYYVEHVTSELPWTTKETPGNNHTKGSIKFKDTLLQIHDDNSAEFKILTESDRSRIRAKQKGYVRIMFGWSTHQQIMQYLKDHGIRHTHTKQIRGSCSTLYYVCDIMHKNDIIMMQLGLPNMFRQLQENEYYYKLYDDAELRKKNLSEEEDEDAYEDDDDDEEANAL